ncbi:MAG: DUF2970 domain-containing protein [Candidatus Methylumidiphilus sp.]
MADLGKDSNNPTLLQVIGSVLAAAFGVQSSKNRERDFRHGNVATFVIVGIVATTLFILLLYSVVRLVLGI